MSIDTEKNIISLRAGDWDAVVVPEIGMNMAALRYRGTPVLREPDSLQTLRSNSVVYGNPLQLPPNRTAHGRFSFDGVEYQLPLSEPARDNNIHGELHRSAFTVTEQGASHVTGIYENRGEIFPFPFIVQADIELSEEGCIETIRITNSGDSDMPLVFGLHTLFTEPEDFAVPLREEWEVNECYIPTGILRPLNQVTQSYTCSGIAHGVRVSGFFTAAGQTARIGDNLLTVSGNFNNWILWNAFGEQGFLAAEPQQGPVNALNSGTDLIRLRPGQTETYTLHFHKV